MLIDSDPQRIGEGLGVRYAWQGPRRLSRGFKGLPMSSKEQGQKSENLPASVFPTLGHIL